MSLIKVNYIDNETEIEAENLNAIQDAIIANESAINSRYTKTETDAEIATAISGAITTVLNTPI